MKTTRLTALLLPLALWAACSSESTAPTSTAATCSPACDAAACQVCDTSSGTPKCVATCGEGATCNAGVCEGKPAATCTPACDACQTCDTSGAAPKCVDACGAGSTCKAGVCVGDPAPKCDPACDADACEMCDTSGDAPKCVAMCGPSAVCNAGKCEAPVTPACEPACGPCEACDIQANPPVCTSLCAGEATCVNGKCEAPKPPTCDPACGPCQTCDTSGPVPVCADSCGPDLLCQSGLCVAPPAVVCAPACGPCEMCDTSGKDPVCVKLCGDGATCDEQTKACISIGNYHAVLGEPGRPLHGPFANAYSVTAKCVSCHPKAAEDFMKTSHWKWSGPTPALVAADGVTPINPGNIGKDVLLNNFCVGVASNEKRCDHCHAGFGGDPDAAKPQKSARYYTSADPVTGDSSIPLTSRVDCLVCHSNPPAGYSKDPKNFGLPPASVNLAVAAQDIRMPTRTNCGACHFYAGGADGVKIMGSSLKNPPESVDVHMGRGMDCATCHASPGHDFRGAGVHTPTHSARVACEDCHSATPHTGKVPNGDTFDKHVAKLACQTCHIPKYSRGQFSKVDWDWSTAGDNQTCAGTPGTCAAGVVTAKVGDDGVTPDPAATTAVTIYDSMKGTFLWKRNVVPTYRWSNGKATHYLTSSKHAAALGETAVDAQRISLGEPVGSAADGRIKPFKFMRGRQAVYVNGANSFVLTPNVFGSGSFWGVTTAPGFQFSAYDYDAAGPIAAGWPSIDALWGKVLAVGGIAAKQLPAGTPPLAKYDPQTPAKAGWAWRYTKLLMDVNHEVAPKAQALGAVGCTDCHATKSPKIPLCELYANNPPAILNATCP